MLAGEIGADDLGANVAGREVHFDAFPTTFPIGVGEEAGEDLGVEIALAPEIAIEAAGWMETLSVPWRLKSLPALSMMVFFTAGR